MALSRVPVQRRVELRVGAVMLVWLGQRRERHGDNLAAWSAVALRGRAGNMMEEIISVPHPSLVLHLLWSPVACFPSP